MEELQAHNEVLLNTVAAITAEHASRRTDLELCRTADVDRIRQLEATVRDLQMRFASPDRRPGASGERPAQVGYGRQGSRASPASRTETQTLLQRYCRV